MTIFETLLVAHGKPLELAGHVQRMQRGTGVNIEAYAKTAAAKLPKYHRLRIDCDPEGKLSLSHNEIPKPDILEGKLAKLQLQSVRLAKDRDNHGYGIYKVAEDRPELERLEQAAAPATPLLLDEHDYILETSRHNVFIIEGDRLVTPPADGRILPGVTRGALLEVAAGLGIRLAEEPIPLKRALKSSSMLVTSSLPGLVWAEESDGKKWSEPARLVYDLNQALTARWQAQLLTISLGDK